MNRGASDVIGFILVFGLIITSIALVSVTAFAAIQDAQESQERQNVLRAFTVLDDNVQEVVNNDADSRATEIDVDENAQLFYGENVTVTVTAINPSSSDDELSKQTSRPIIYRISATEQIVYVNGAIIQSFGDNSTMYRDPKVYKTSDGRNPGTYFSTLSIQPSDGSTTGVGGGTRTIHIRSDGDSAEIEEPPSNGNVTYKIDGTENQEAWVNWCKGYPLNVDPPGINNGANDDDDTVVCEADQIRYRIYYHNSNIKSEIS